MSDMFIVAGPVLAAEVSGGTGGFLVVLLLCVAAAGLFVAMSTSLRRMRANVTRGEFGTRPMPSVPAEPAADPVQDPDSGRAPADIPIPPQR